MQRIDTSSHPTLAAMFPKGFFPRLHINVPDSGAPGGVINYEIRMKKDEDVQRYDLYFEGHKVPYPEGIYATYKQIFDDSIRSQADASSSRHIYEDLNLIRDGDTPPYIAEKTLAKIDRPTLHRSQDVRATPVVREEYGRRTPDLESEVSLKDKIEESYVHIKRLVAEGKLPVYSLPDNSGHYTNIVDNMTGQVHQVGYSWKKKGAWHTVYQLRDSIDPAHTLYEIPKPRLESGQLVLDGLRGNSYLKLIYQKTYDVGLMKLFVKSMLGTLDIPSREYVSGGITQQTQSFPHNVIPFDPRKPDWRMGEVPERKWEASEVPDVSTRRRQYPDNTDSITSSSGPEGSYARSDSLRRPVSLRMRAIDLVDPSFQASDWLKTAIPRDAALPALEPNPIERGLDERGWPSYPREIHPLWEGAASSSPTYPRLVIPTVSSPLPFVAVSTDFTPAHKSRPSYRSVDKTPSTFGDPYARLGFI